VEMGLLREEIGVIADLCRMPRDEEKKVNRIEVRRFFLSSVSVSVLAS